MADAILSIVLERLTAIAEEKIRSEVSLLRGVKKEVLELSDKLETIRNVLEDAERRGVKEESVRGWLKKLEDTAYKMDDILDEWNYYAIDASATKKVYCSFIPSLSLCLKKLVVRHDTAKKIQKVKSSLDQILKEKDEFNFVISTLPTIDSAPRFETTSSIDLEKIQGQNVERNKNVIVRKLVTDGDRQQILSIVGMGGIGKTTLAQLVHNDSRVKDWFDLRIWICVSDPFDVVAVARGIIEICGRKIPSHTNRLEVLLQKLRDCISGKKFLLVLDDVWTEDHKKWEPLKINLKYGVSSSKILVTTRNERVAKMMGTLDNEIYRPQQLSDEEGWSLLHCISLLGRRKEECGEFEEVGKKIASKCKGLPLAVNVLGSVLRFKNSLEDWENVLESEIWQLDEAQLDLYPHLLLSYNELSPTLKRCFTYCAVYPKDSNIDVERLIEKWMALGYLGSVVGNRGLEHKGREYFNNLAVRSLFQDFDRSDRGKEIKSCKMHDIVHDFAQFLKKNVVEDPRMTKITCQDRHPFLVPHAQEFRSLFWDTGSPLYLCDCLASLKVLKYRRQLSARGMEKLIHLRWLDVSHTRLSKDDLQTIFKLYFLQSLFMVSCSIKEIPGEIENLVNLRYLNLSLNQKLKELPDSMCNLVELENLLLAFCSVKEIPTKIGNLVQLRHLNLAGNEELVKLPESICSLVELKTLDIKQCDNLHIFPKGLAQLSDLRSLNCFFAGSGFNRFGLLKNLNNLTGFLSLTILVSSNSSRELVDDAREAGLRNKIHLKKLSIKFTLIDKRDVNECSSSLLVDVIEALEPNQNLEFLEICEYEISRLPNWISSPLNLVKEIELILCFEVSSLPCMGKLPLLERLCIRRLNKLKTVGVDWLGIRGKEVTDNQSSSLVAFPKLKKLEFYKCPEWSEWEDIMTEEEEEEEYAFMSIMPCLTHLILHNCNGLKTLPHRLLRKASYLQLLEIKGSSHLMECYGDKDGSLWRSIALNNVQLVF